MLNQFSSLTEKMKYLYFDIVSSLGQLPMDQRTYLFGSPDEENMELVLSTACSITLEYIKDAFDYNDPEYSLRHFLKERNDSEDERMRQSRIMELVLKYKKREIERSGVDLPPNHKFAGVSMDTIEAKLKGYRLTEMNFYENQNIAELEIVKAIVMNRIGSAKKISNTRFQEIFEQYDAFIEDLIEKSKVNDDEMVFYSIAFFTLEWHYPVELFYYIACIMEESDMQEINKSDLRLLCGNVSVESMFYGWVSTQSRMIKERFIFADLLFNRKIASVEKEELKTLIIEIIALIVQYKESIYRNDRKYKDWFRTESNTSDWASFFRSYDIFSIWEKKEWTPKRIQNMRKLFELTTLKKI